MEELVQEMPGKQRRSLWGKLASLLQVVLQELPPERWEEPRPEEEEGGMEMEQAVDPVSSPGCLWGKVADFSVVEKERKSKRTWKCLSRPQKQVMAVVDGVTLVAAVSVKVLQEGDTYDTLLDTAHRLHGPCSSGSALKHCFQNQNESASSWQSYFQTLYMNKTTNINRAESRTPWACCSPLLCWSSQWWMGFFYHPSSWLKPALCPSPPDVLLSLPASKAALQQHIHTLCEAWWKKELQEKEAFGRTALLLSLQRSLVLKKSVSIPKNLT